MGLRICVRGAGPAHPGTSTRTREGLHRRRLTAANQFWLRALLADPARPPGEPSTPRLYALLLRTGEADVPCHLAMARHLADSGKHEEALRLLDAVTLLAPASRDAWLARAAFERARGDEAAAASCEVQAAALAAADVPVVAPAPRGAAC